MWSCKLDHSAFAYAFPAARTEHPVVSLSRLAPGNYLPPDGVAMLSAALRRLPSLRVLSLEGCGMEGPQVRAAALPLGTPAAAKPAEASWQRPSYSMGESLQVRKSLVLSSYSRPCFSMGVHHTCTSSPRPWQVAAVCEAVRVSDRVLDLVGKVVTGIINPHNSIQVGNRGAGQARGHQGVY